MFKSTSTSLILAGILVAKHFITSIGEASFTWRRDQDNIDAEAAFDGIYVIRTPVPAAELDAAGAVAACKDLAHIGSHFKVSKDDLDLRPIWHRLQGSGKAHMQAADLLARRRLRDIHPLRGVGEGAYVDDRHKVAQVPQIHPPFLGAR